MIAPSWGTGDQGRVVRSSDQEAINRVIRHSTICPRIANLLPLHDGIGTMVADLGLEPLVERGYQDGVARQKPEPGALGQFLEGACIRSASAFVRDATTRMGPGPAGMAQGQSLDQRLAAREAMLNSRLDAIRSVHATLSGLTGALNDSQKRTLDAVSAEFMPGGAYDAI